jgi:hypothetical protein
MADVENGIFHKERKLEEQDSHTCILVMTSSPNTPLHVLTTLYRFTNWILGRDINRF